MSKAFWRKQLICGMLLAILTPPSAPAADISDVLASRTTLNYIRQNLSGDVFVDVEGDVLRARDSRFIGFTLAVAAAKCGLDWALDPVEARRIIVLRTISEATVSGVETVLDDILARYGITLKTLERATVSSSMLSDIASSGLTNFELADAANDKRLLISVADGSLIDLADSTAATWFLTSSAIAGLRPQSVVNNQNKYSYLFGGGDLAELIGPSEERFSRFCRAAGIVKALCEVDGVVEGPVDLSALDATCEMGADGESAFRLMSEQYVRAEEDYAAGRAR